MKTVLKSFSERINFESVVGDTDTDEGSFGDELHKHLDNVTVCKHRYLSDRRLSDLAKEYFKMLFVLAEHILLGNSTDKANMI